MFFNRRLVACALALLAAGCGGGDSPSGPSGGSGGSGGGTNKTLTLTIDGVAFTANIVTAVRSNPGIETVTVGASSSNGTTVGFGAPAQVGVFNVNGPVTARGQGNMTIISGSTGTGYIAFLTQGSGTVTISAISATSVAGRVDLVMAPTTTGASKTVSGTFDIAF